MMFLQGTKVNVRSLVREDILNIVKWKSDPEIADLVRGGPIHTSIEIENKRFDRRMEGGETIRLLVETKQKKAIGFISLGEIDKENKKAELGMLIGEKDFWDRGYGTDALITLLEHLFTRLDFNRIGLEVFDYNLRAMKAYEKIGFKVEGIQRQGLYRLNKFHDIYIMGLLRQDYLNLKNEAAKKAKKRVLPTR
jgi:RimJ/RimL family protein N-acetyltransferase